MLYFFLKYIHVISSTILFGTGIGTAAVMYYGHLTKKPDIMAAINHYVVNADWMFTATSAVVQLITGLWMIYLAGYSFKLFWVWTSILGYTIAGACWLPVVYFQIKMRDWAIDATKNQMPLPPIYHRYFRYWFLLGWPAFTSLLIVFYLMLFKPVI